MRIETAILNVTDNSQKVTNSHVNCHTVVEDICNYNTLCYDFIFKKYIELKQIASVTKASLTCHDTKKLFSETNKSLHPLALDQIHFLKRIQQDTLPLAKMSMCNLCIPKAKYAFSKESE